MHRVGWWLWAGLLLFGPFSAAANDAPAPQGGKPRLLFDFEDGPLSDRWTAAAEVVAARESLPAKAAGEGLVPAGAGLRLTAKAAGGIATQRDAVPRDWRRVRAIEFWVYRSPAEAERHPTAAIEIRLAEADGKARFWRKVETQHHGWQKYSLPLAWFRWGDDRVPRWDQIGRLGVYCRGPGEW
jgi:hypothetical protein